MSESPIPISVDELVERYDSFGFDSYGVLVDGNDPLPGALQLTRRLNRLGKSWIVATNDASRLPRTRLDTMRKQGFEIEMHQLVTSGMLLKGYFERRGLIGTQSIVTGFGETVEYVALAGCQPVGLDSKDDASASLVLAGIQGFNWDATLEEMLSLIFRRIDSGHPLYLAVPNPDVLYPNGIGRYAIGPGGLAGLIESALAQAFPESIWTRFERLGKPHAPIFDEIKARFMTDTDIIFIGDQINTDIAGANNAGLHSALIGTGVSRQYRDRASDFIELEPSKIPTYLIDALDTGIR